MTNTSSTPTENTEAMRTTVESLASAKGPTIFQIRPQLPKKGRTDTPLAATELMNVVIKTYAADGENELHAHPNEDHVFVVLQGEAGFHGPRGETHIVGRHGGILLPRGTLYWFKAIGEIPLVMLRIGAATDLEADPLARVDEHGNPFDGYSQANKQVDVQMHEPPLFFE
jgi:mannose-6-phosphate isomerase-like protein (cupin superfamily)